MISTNPDVDTEEFERRTGWLITPEGACKDDRCVPLSGPVSETIDLRVVAARLRMPLVHDQAVGVWCLGPEAGGKALANARAPDLTLADWRGDSFQLSSLLGQKVLLVAWASW